MYCVSCSFVDKSFHVKAAGISEGHLLYMAICPICGGNKVLASPGVSESQLRLMEITEAPPIDRDSLVRDIVNGILAQRKLNGESTAIPVDDPGTLRYIANQGTLIKDYCIRQDLKDLVDYANKIAKSD